MTEAEGVAVRRYLWWTHGHTGLYGDDGEMQCGSCLLMHQASDYKRDPIEKLIQSHEAALKHRYARQADLKTAARTLVSRIARTRTHELVPERLKELSRMIEDLRAAVELA